MSRVIQLLSGLKLVLRVSVNTVKTACAALRVETTWQFRLSYAKARCGKQVVVYNVRKLGANTATNRRDT